MANELSTKRFIRMFKCDMARILAVGGEMFLIIGKNRHSKGEWIRNGEPYEFDYVEETVIASGTTKGELLKSAQEYKATLRPILRLTP